MTFATPPRRWCIVATYARWPDTVYDLVFSSQFAASNFVGAMMKLPPKGLPRLFNKLAGFKGYRVVPEDVVNQ